MTSEGQGFESPQLHRRGAPAQPDDACRPCGRSWGPVYIVGGLLFGVATFRAAILPRWTGALLVLSRLLAPLAALLPNASQPKTAIPMASRWRGSGMPSGRTGPRWQPPSQSQNPRPSYECGRVRGAVRPPTGVSARRGCSVCSPSSPFPRAPFMTASEARIISWARGDTPAVVGGDLGIIVALAGIGTAVVLYPILKRQNAARILESGTIFVGVAPFVVGRDAAPVRGRCRCPATISTHAVPDVAGRWDLASTPHASRGRRVGPFVTARRAEPDRACAPRRSRVRVTRSVAVSAGAEPGPDRVQVPDRGDV
jgi:hypothetical protein